MRPAARFRYVVVASNLTSGERVTAGAVSSEALQGLVAELRASGLTQIQIRESLAAYPPTLVAAAE